MASAAKLVDVNFEIIGKVQGVFFRKYTQKEAKRLHLVGWVMNASSGSVKGQVQGPEEKVEQMKKWLKTKGSPSSRIEKATFSKNEIEKLTYESFTIKK